MKERTQLEEDANSIFRANTALSQIRHWAVDGLVKPEQAEELKAKGAEFIKEPFEALPGMTLAFFDGLNGVNLQLFNWKRG